MAKAVLTILAHPDDAEFLCAGTLIRLKAEHGYEVHIASLTPGDCGSTVYTADEISRIRRREGARAAGLIGATYHCLEERDLRVCYNEQTLEKATGLLRAVKPTLVLTHSPADYMLDHEMTSTIARAACFAGSAPNFLPAVAQPAASPWFSPLDAIPHLYYCDAIEGKDLFGNEVRPQFCIDISNVIDTKVKMLAAHASQREWLRKQHGMDQYIQAMHEWGQKRGQSCGVAYAEGFRQHLGHSYPQDNLLGRLLHAKPQAA
jgi:N-acetylglucosamine malate deacetylase 1